MTQLYATTFRAMGCQINIWLETDSDGSILQQASTWVEEMEACLSRFRPESELSQLNTHLGEWQPVSPALLANVMAAKHGARLTDGLYNPLVLDALAAAGYERSFEHLGSGPASSGVPAVADWRDIQIDAQEERVCLPARIDLGGVAKGWAAQTIARQLKPYGPCLVDIGGDIAVEGAPSGKAGWEIAVAEPGGQMESAAVLHLSLASGSVVTSGTDYRRWYQAGRLQHHLIDPRTGLPAVTDVQTATVIHPHAPTAEVYAKAIVMLGAEVGLEWLNRQPKGAALVICQDGRVIATDHFLDYVLEGEKS
jgi:thiamine biosynthesis lipoprotein